jgi:phasin
MDRSTSGQFEIPQEMRAFAEKSVEQARQAFESFLSTAHQTINAFGDQAETTRQGAKDIGQQVMAFAERNITSSFEFAQHLVRARDVNEMVKLQSDYITAQIKTLSEQAKELGETTAKLAREATKPKSS